MNTVPNQQVIIFGDPKLPTKGDKGTNDYFGRIPRGEMKEVLRRLSDKENYPSSVDNKAYVVSDEKVYVLWSYLYVMFSKEYEGVRCPFSPAMVMNELPFTFKTTKKVTGARKRLIDIGAFKQINKNTYLFVRDLRHSEEAKEYNRNIIIASTSDGWTDEDTRDLEKFALGQNDVTEEKTKSVDTILREMELRTIREAIEKGTRITDQWIADNKICTLTRDEVFKVYLDYDM